MGDGEDRGFVEEVYGSSAQGLDPRKSGDLRSRERSSPELRGSDLASRILGSLYPEQEAFSGCCGLYSDEPGEGRFVPEAKRLAMELYLCPIT